MALVADPDIVTIVEHVKEAEGVVEPVECVVTGAEEVDHSKAFGLRAGANGISAAGGLWME